MMTLATQQPAPNAKPRSTGFAIVHILKPSIFCFSIFSKVLFFILNQYYNNCKLVISHCYDIKCQSSLIILVHAVSALIISSVKLKLTMLRLEKLKLPRLRTNNRRKPKHTQQLIQNQEFDPLLYQKFTKFLNNQRLASLKHRLNEFYGKNFIINYKKQYQFFEEWENKKHEENSRSEFEILNQEHSFGIIVSFVIMVTYTVAIWFRNLDYFFKDESESTVATPVYVLALICQVADVIIKFWYYYEPQEDQEFQIMPVVTLFYQNLISSFFLVAVLAAVNQVPSEMWSFIELVSLYFMYRRAKQIYESFRFMNFTFSYEYQLKTINLIFNLLMLVHFLAIIVYQITKCGQAVTWFSALNLGDSSQFIRYIYSFYFCATTILTVGYGDITPKNYIEVVMVTFIEMFGIIIFAYLINQIGFSLTAMRKDREIVEKQLSLVEKMRKYYNMEDDLVHKVRGFLINHKPRVDQLSPSEEQGLMMKFNQELRNKIVSNNTLSIVKSSIFFLCRWTKAMQTAVASKLVNCLFSPGQLIYQPLGKQRIYIIRLGKIDIYTERKGDHNGNKSILKSIKTNLQTQVCDNCYGYTAVISTRPVRLYAISKDSTSAYYVDKQKFIGCINEKGGDFQYYHEIKSKIDHSSLWQSLQVPSLSNSKHHYNPTHFKIFIGNKRNLRMNEGEGKRTNYVRRSKNLSINRNSIIHNIQSVNIIRKALLSSVDDINNTEISLNFLFPDNKSLKQIYKSKIKQTDSCEQINIQGIMVCHNLKHFHHFFQKSKEYDNYFPRSNKKNVLRKMQNQHFMNSQNVAIQEVYETFRVKGI